MSVLYPVMVLLAVIGTVGMVLLTFRRWQHDRVTIQGRRWLLIDLCLLISMMEMVVDTIAPDRLLLTFILRGALTVGVLTLLVTFPGIPFERLARRRMK